VSDAARRDGPAATRVAAEAQVASTPELRAEGGAAGQGSGGSDCARVRQALLHAQRPGERLAEPIERHLGSCPGCGVFRGELRLLDSLTREQRPPLPEGFELALRRRLQAAGTPPRQHLAARGGAAWMRPLLAAAALLLLVLGGVQLARRGRDAAGPASYHRLHLAIAAARDHGEVLFDVELPVGVRAAAATAELVGRGARLQWRSSLRRGVNVMDLPLVAQQAGGEVRVRLQAGAVVRTGTVGFVAPGRVARRVPGAPAGGLTLALGLVPADRSGGQP